MSTHLLSDLRNMSSSACILQQRACLLWSEGQEVATRWWPSSREVAGSTWVMLVIGRVFVVVVVLELSMVVVLVVIWGSCVVSEVEIIVMVMVIL